MMDCIETKASLSVTDEGEITGTAWVFAKADRVGDVIEKAAFAKSAAPLPMLASHDSADVVGVWDVVGADDRALQVKGRLLVGDVARAREVRALVQAGAITGLSIGFRTRKALPRKGGGRTITDLDLLEVSLVAVPAHPDARIISAKAGTAGKDPMSDDHGAPDLAALEGKMAETAEAVKALPKLAERLDKLEAKANRPTGETEPKAEPSAEHKAFAAYLRHGAAAPAEELKVLLTAIDPQGGYLAPPEMSTEFIRDLVEFSPIRSVASVRQTTAPSVVYPTRTGITNARWVGETQTRTESEPTFGQAEIAAKELATYVEVSNRLLADSAGQAESEVRLALAEDFAQKEAQAFLWGDGILEPEGLMTRTDIPETANGHATNLSADALIGLMYALPAPYRRNGTWAMNGTTLAALRKIKDTAGQYIWQPSIQVGQPETILGRPVIEMIDLADPAANEHPIIFGDFSGYRIVDRVQMSILVDPYTRATNGITRIHATRRVGGGVLQPQKFRKLKMAVS